MRNIWGMPFIILEPILEGHSQRFLLQSGETCRANTDYLRGTEC